MKKTKLKIKSLLISTLILSPSIVIAEDTITDEAIINATIKSVMMVHYNVSNYDHSRNCFVSKYKSNSGVKNYCLKSEYDIRIIDGTPTIYLKIYSKTTEEVARATNGLGGFFVLKPLTDSLWLTTHSSPYIELGQSGISSLAKLKLTKIGKDNYGWSGEISHSGGGQNAKFWILYAPVDKASNSENAENNIGNDQTINSVAEHTIYYEYNMSGNKGTVAIDSNTDGEKKWYPLIITTQECNFDHNLDECEEATQSTMKFVEEKQEYVQYLQLHAYLEK